MMRTNILDKVAQRYSVFNNIISNSANIRYRTFICLFHQTKLIEASNNALLGSSFLMEIHQ